MSSDRRLYEELISKGIEHVHLNEHGYLGHYVLFKDGTIYNKRMYRFSDYQGASFKFRNEDNTRMQRYTVPFLLNKFFGVEPKGNFIYLANHGYPHGYVLYPDRRVYGTHEEKYMKLMYNRKLKTHVLHLRDPDNNIVRITKDDVTELVESRFDSIRLSK